VVPPSVLYAKRTDAGPVDDRLRSTLNPVTLNPYPVLGVADTSTAGNALEYVVVLEKLVEEKPVEHGVPGVVAPSTLDNEVPVAFAATVFNAPETSLV